MGKDITIIPHDFITHYVKTEELLLQDVHGNYAYHVKTERIPLIRCGECKYWNYEMSGCNRNPGLMVWRDDDFCPYGERKDDER